MCSFHLTRLHARKPRQSIDLQSVSFLLFHVFSVHLFIPALCPHLISFLAPPTLLTLFQSHQLPCCSLNTAGPVALGRAASPASFWTLSLMSSSTIWHTVFYLFDHWLCLLLEHTLHSSRSVCVCVFCSITGQFQLLVCFIQCCSSNLRTVPDT